MTQSVQYDVSPLRHAMIYNLQSADAKRRLSLCENTRADRFVREHPHLKVMPPSVRTFHLAQGRICPVERVLIFLMSTPK